MRSLSEVIEEIERKETEAREFHKLCDKVERHLGSRQALNDILTIGFRKGSMEQELKKVLESDDLYYKNIKDIIPQGGRMGDDKGTY
jgi:hypothetical protein